MSPEVVGGILGFLGGVAGGLLAFWGSYWQRRSADRALEGDEIRRRKIEIVYQLFGSRYVLTDGYEPSYADVRPLNTALCLVPVYFSDNKEIMRRYDALMNDMTNGKLMELLKEAARSLDFDLLDSVTMRVLSVKPRGAGLRSES